MTSNSWGGGGFSQTMFDAISAANTKGSLFIAAAGNSSSNNDSSAAYPASYDIPNVISVAASDHNDQMAYFSNFGIRTVHVAAPGVDIYSAVPGNTYENMSGTSMATPHVAGVAALVKAAIPSATGAQIKARIISGVDRSDYWSTKVQSGGRINALSALEIDNIPPARVSDIAVTGASTLGVSLSWAPVGDDGANGRASFYQVRISKTPINSDADWQAAKAVSVAPQMVNGRMEGTLTFDDFNQAGYVAVKGFDNVGNESRGVQSVPFAAQAVQQFYNRNAVDMTDFTADAPWALETLEDGSTVFSDSPGVSYGPSLNVSLTSAAIMIPSTDVTLSLELNASLESGYDFLHVEMSTDGGTSWSKVDKMTGDTAGFVRKLYTMPGVSGDSEILVRLRLETDSSIAKQGVQVRNMSMLAPR